jgi:hypothetical protein
MSDFNLGVPQGSGSLAYCVPPSIPHAADAGGNKDHYITKESINNGITGFAIRDFFVLN